MNSEKPRKPQSDFSQSFDNEEIEIDVSYEEITPEEQLKIKQRAKEGIDSASEQLSDMWLDDEPEIVGSRRQVNSNEIAQEEVLDSSPSEVDEPKPLLDDLAVEAPHESEAKISPDLEPITDSRAESGSEGMAIENTEPTAKITQEGEFEITESKSELILDDVAKFNDPIAKITQEREFEITKPESLEDENETETESTSEPKDLEEQRDRQEIATNDLEPIGEVEPTPEPEITKELSPAVERLDSSVNEPEEVAVGSLDSSVNEPEEIKEPNSEPELIADSWLDETENRASEEAKRGRELELQIAQLEEQKTRLQQEIAQLQEQKAVIAQKNQAIAENMVTMVEEGTKELKERKNNLLIDIEKLERRAERIRQEMRTNFAGASQDLAVRIQGFKEYLVGSLQDLSTAAERLELPKPEVRRPLRRETRPPQESDRDRPSSRNVSSQPQFTEQAFADQTRRIRQLIEKYRTQPNYYGSPWQLRRTFEPIHAQKVQEWFFEQGGRGAIKGMGSRLQNILVASAVISILYRLYRDRCRILVLVDTPEKLGEWRRGLQDCLGISRNDFGTNRGVILFESADILVQRADRLLEDKLLPLIIIDETEELINLGLLKFPLWLAFAEKSQSKSDRYLY